MTPVARQGDLRFPCLPLTRLGKGVVDRQPGLKSISQGAHAAAKLFPADTCVPSEAHLPAHASPDLWVFGANCHGKGEPMSHATWHTCWVRGDESNEQRGCAAIPGPRPDEFSTATAAQPGMRPTPPVGSSVLELLFPAFLSSSARPLASLLCWRCCSRADVRVGVWPDPSACQSRGRGAARLRQVDSRPRGRAEREILLGGHLWFRGANDVLFR